MLALWIILGIVLFDCLLLSTRAVLVIEADSELRLALRFLFIRIPIYPRTVSPRQQLRKMERAKRMETKKAKRHGKGKSPHPAPHRNRKPSDVLHTVKLVTRILQRIYRRFSSSFRLKLTRVKLLVGGKDAADAAIRYGAVRAALAYLLTALEAFVTVKTTRKSELSIEPNFLSSASSCDIHITLSASLRAILSLVIRALLSYLWERKHSEKASKNRAENGQKPAGAMK